MKRSSILAFVLSCGVWVFSQAAWGQTYGGSAQTSSDQSQTSVQGCLAGSSGNYTLTDKSGTTYQLAGDTSKLSEHVGHTVEVKGTKSASSPTSSGPTSTGPGSTSKAGSMNQSTLNVSSVNHVSETCGAAK
jgi:hypothetical protein